MYMATVIFSTNMGASKETYLLSNTIEGINKKIERFKVVLKQNKISYSGSIIEDRPDLGEANKLQEAALIASGLDFIEQDSTLIH